MTDPRTPRTEAGRRLAAVMYPWLIMNFAEGESRESWERMARDFVDYVMEADPTLLASLGSSERLAAARSARDYRRLRGLDAAIAAALPAAQEPELNSVLNAMKVHNLADEDDWT
jgi:hypothetical protein